VARVEDCPRSRAVGVTEIMGAERAALTLTLTRADVTVTGELELSVIWISNDQDPMFVMLPVGIETGEVQGEELPRVVKLLAPGAFWSHLQTYGEVPPVNVAERFADWPVSIAGGVAEGVLMTSVGLTVTEAGDPLLLLPLWVESLPYEPTMLAAPEADGVNFTLQLDVEPVPTKVQFVALKLPVTPVSVKPTEPFGVVAAIVEVSVTVAVHVDAWLARTGLEHETLILVECLPGDNTEEPVLPLCVLSPV